MKHPPIALFTYARPNHTRRTVESLLCNPQASAHDLIVFSDAARTPEKRPAVGEVRAYLATISGFRSVTIHHRPQNLGLAKSIIGGVTQILTDHERIIVLEDDMVTSPHFLAYMNEALERFAEDERVISIHGYVYPVQETLSEAFFLRGADCWGWATWRRGWRLFNPDGQALLDELQRRNLLKAFDFNDTYSYSKMLESQIKGTNDSWAVRWYASAFLADKLTLYPGRSLVHNIGNDSSGTHCGESTQFDSELSETLIDLSNVKVEASQDGQMAFEDFFRRSNKGRAGLVRKVFATSGLSPIKAAAKDWLPPALLRWARKIIHGRGGRISFEGDYTTWEEAAARCTGYDAAPILVKVLDATLKVKRSEAAYERDSVVFEEIEFAWPVTAALMWAAAQSGGRLDVLDFGGALGSSYFQNRTLLANLPEVRWSVIEQVHYVEAGREHIQDDTLRFYSSIDSCLAENKPNVVLFSSVLQYLPQVERVIKQIDDSGATTLIIDRTPFSDELVNKICVQHVPDSIYRASYPMKIFSLNVFMGNFVNWEVVAKIPCPEGSLTTGSGVDMKFLGLILRRKNAQ